MKLFDKLYLNLFTKAGNKLIAKDGHFELQLPEGFRYKYSGGMYQVIDPADPSFVFQISAFALDRDPINDYNTDKELANALRADPAATVRSIGKFHCIYFSSAANGSQAKIYIWKTGERNKRILITLLIRYPSGKDINNKVALAEQLIQGLSIMHKV